MSEGDPIPNYYPKAIPEELFYQVQEAIEKNSKSPGRGGGGGKHDMGRNLFPYIAKCGFCGASMRYLNKGDGPKGGEYLRCDNSYRKVKDEHGKSRCSAIAIRYNEFMDLVLDNFKELDITRLFPDDEEVKSQIKKNSNQLKHQINTVNTVREQLENSQDEEEEIRIRLKLREALYPLDNRRTYKLEDGTWKTATLDKFIIRFRKSQVKYIQVVSLFKGPEEIGPVYATTLNRKAKHQ